MELPRVSGAETVSAWSALLRVPRPNGSHRKMRHPDGRTAIVPMHRELAPGTLRSILKQAGLSVDQLRELL